MFPDQEDARGVLQNKYGIKDIIGLKPLPSYEDQNFHVTAKVADDLQHDYILKIMNNALSKNPDICSVQSHAMAFLRECGFPTPMTFPTTGGEMLSFFSVDLDSDQGSDYIVRLLEYMPGVPLSKVVVQSDMFYKLGNLTAFMNLTLQVPFCITVVTLHLAIKCIKCVLMPLLEVLNGNPIKKLVCDVLQVCTSSLLPKLPYCRLIHGDLNDYNILVEECMEENYKISGIIDFSDLFPGYYMSELAILMVYTMGNHPEKMMVGGHVIAGYESVMPLTAEEKDSLFFIVVSRLASSIVLCQHTARNTLKNTQYLFVHYSSICNLLQDLWEAGKEKVEELWFDVVDLYSSKLN
uniref:Hydroxylysine kinase n=1 Tax=Eptatretus burgeri TaxID=7764 RepID=A0A8C4X1G3_EPTBU